MGYCTGNADITSSQTMYWGYSITWPCIKTWIKNCDLTYPLGILENSDICAIAQPNSFYVDAVPENIFCGSDWQITIDWRVQNRFEAAVCNFLVYGTFTLPCDQQKIMLGTTWSTWCCARKHLFWIRSEDKCLPMCTGLKKPFSVCRAFKFLCDHQKIILGTTYNQWCFWNYHYYYIACYGIASGCQERNVLAMAKTSVAGTWTASRAPAHRVSVCEEDFDLGSWKLEKLSKNVKYFWIHNDCSDLDYLDGWMDYCFRMSDFDPVSFHSKIFFYKRI